MKLFGIEFAPINIPLRRRLQTLAAAAWFITIAFGGIFGMIFCIYLLFTRLWWLSLMYLGWAWIIDKDICEKGGRRIEWVKTWSWWAYFRDYFPLKLERLPWVELDEKKNYLFCYFPHGMLTLSSFSAFGAPCTASELFPKHKPHVITLHQHYSMPLFRDLALALGGCSASAKSLNYLLSKPEGGNIAVLMVGGAAEAYYCRPGKYKVVLKRRKGFVKLALKNGAPLVPVLAFGETDLYNQFDNPEGSTFKRIQEVIRKVIGLAPIIPLGRGFFQYSFGIVPHRRPVTTVVGHPIDVPKIEEPTREQVEEYHQKFVKALSEMFEEQKYNYLKEAETTFLEIV